MSHERSGAWTIDHAVRVLATGCAQRRRPLPAVGAVVLGPESVTLRLATPDEAPPPGWTVEDDGRTWLSSLGWLKAAAVDGRIRQPYPLLVSVGAIGGGRLLLNLAQADGLISVGGDPGLARSLVRLWSRRLTTSPWTRARVIRVGFPPDPDFAGWDVSLLAEAASVLDDPEGGVLFFADPPVGRDRDQVDRLFSGRVRRWSVVAVGGPANSLLDVDLLEADPAAWRLTVRVDGTVDTGLLAEPVLLRP